MVIVQRVEALEFGVDAMGEALGSGGVGLRKILCGHVLQAHIWKTPFLLHLRSFSLPFIVMPPELQTGMFLQKLTSYDLGR